MVGGGREKRNGGQESDREKEKVMHVRGTKKQKAIGGGRYPRKQCTLWLNGG